MRSGPARRLLYHSEALRATGLCANAVLHFRCFPRRRTDPEPMELRRRIAIAALLLLVVTSASVFGYRLLGHEVGLLQALYMAVITLAGVGYGEFVDTSHNPLLRVFNMFVVLFGVMITAYVFSSVTAFLVG